MTAGLNAETVFQLPPQVIVPGYPRVGVKRGIFHIGIGNFHRAHQAVYCDDLLSAGELDWGITGLSLRSSTVRDRLMAQDGLYTLVKLDDPREYRVVGSVQEVLFRAEDAGRYVAALASPDVSMITVTITEKGYLLANGKLHESRREFNQDLAALNEPHSVYGVIAKALMERAARGTGPVTVVCCDNIPAGGAVLEEGAHALLNEHRPSCAAWARDNVSFVSSLVDRVTPATDDRLIEQTFSVLGIRDECPVSTEVFSQWVIEDNFAGRRPPLHPVGVEFVPSVSMYASMKLSYLNAAHSIVAVIGALAGVEHVHEALLNEDLLRFTRRILNEEVDRAATLPPGADGDRYIDEIFARFRNAAVPYKVAQVCSDSSEKIAQRWFPTIDSNLAIDRLPRGFAFVLAAWVRYVKAACEHGVLVDPKRAALSRCLREGRTAEHTVKTALCVAGAGRFAFAEDERFMQCVTEDFRDIGHRGIAWMIRRFAGAAVERRNDNA